MASLAQWIEGARPRTFPNAVAPVIAGTGAAAWLHSAVWWKALLALLVAVTMIIGVNFANDYSDGIRGTDDERAGPLRLVGSRLATPRSVLTVAVLSMSVAAVAGLALALSSAPWLIAVGAFCIAAGGHVRIIFQAACTAHGTMAGWPVLRNGSRAGDRGHYPTPSHR